MIAATIRWSIANRGLVLAGLVALAIAGLLNLRTLPVDAIPDLSDVQVIVKTSYPGQAPQVVEDQVTYPLTTALLSVPGAETVRGYSFFGDSYVYVIFDDDTDLYWARSRVLEYLSQVAPGLPAEARPAIGPDATGVGWIYEYALVDRSGRHDLSELRAIQDWFLKYELQTVPGVAEVATVGGMVKQYQVVVDPDRLRSFDLTLPGIRDAIRRGNSEVGGSVIEMAETEFMVRATGYIEGLEELRQIPVKISPTGTPVLLEEVAEIRLGPQLRRGIAELDGEGEVTGGIIVMRFGENAQRTIDAVKERLDELRASLPEGVEVVATYDRSELIGRAIDTLKGKLLEEFLLVALICAVFLLHARSALVAVATLPLGILAALAILRLQGLNANIMSLGGIAIAIGAMVDAAIVMIENTHKHLAEDRSGRSRWEIVARATTEVGPPIFFSLLIITLSFLPVFTLEAQEGRLFAPLAWTKTWAMAASAALAITAVPVLIGYLVRGRIRPEEANPVNRALRAAYRPVIGWVSRAPWLFIVAGIALMLSALYPASRLGAEFMPPLDEGDWMYMPTTRPGLSIGEAAQLLQQTDRLIKSVPEVAQVFGKIGRAETATDPAPLTMIETLIRFKPESEWRAGYDIEDIRAEIRERVQLPGVTNAWVMPIKTRIDMLATGIKTPVGIKIGGPDLDVIQAIGADIERLLPEVEGTASVFAEKVAGGRYVVVDIERGKAARYGLVRENVQAIRDLPVVTPGGARIRLGDVARVEVEDGPPMLKSENGRLNGWVYVDITGRDVGSYVAAAQALLRERLELPPGYSLRWSGQYEYMERAKQRLAVVVPLTLGIIALLLYLAFRGFTEVLIVLGTVPMSLTGGIWLLYWMDFDLSVAVAVGFIALAGVAVEIGVLMLVYLDLALARHREENPALSRDELREVVHEGALRRLRPIVMTMASIALGLLPILRGGGTGAEVMQRIAAPMVGGMVSTLALALLVIPAIYLVWKRRSVAA
ncbi:MAG: CusA/CzcA family heavy metal efflux RND transporter [Gammaproteobacteria bacterium]